MRHNDANLPKKEKILSFLSDNQSINTFMSKGAANTRAFKRNKGVYQPVMALINTQQSHTIT